VDKQRLGLFRELSVSTNRRTHVHSHLPIDENTIRTGHDLDCPKFEKVLWLTMDSGPPPYSEHPGPQGSPGVPNRLVADALVNPDLDRHSHSRPLLVSAFGQSGLAAVYCHAMSGGNCGNEQINMVDLPRQVQGFRQVGSFHVPADYASDPHEYVSHILTTVADASHNSLDMDNVLENSIKQLTSELPRQDDDGAMTLFTLPVYFDIPDAAAEDRLVWKWAKPDSTYPRKTGYWEESLQDAITDADWNAGGGVMILARYVAETEWEEMTRGGKKIIHFISRRL
jgi:hypothetical protein